MPIRSYKTLWYLRDSPESMICSACIIGKGGLFHAAYSKCKSFALNSYVSILRSLLLKQNYLARDFAFVEAIEAFIDFFQMDGVSE